MFAAYVVVTALAIAANAYMSTMDLMRHEQVLTNMSKVNLPQSTLLPLGLLKAAGALGLAVGFGVPAIGVAAAAGLTLFFVGAIITHVRAHEYSLQYPGTYLVLAVGSLVLRLATI